MAFYEKTGICVYVGAEIMAQRNNAETARKPYLTPNRLLDRSIPPTGQFAGETSLEPFRDLPQ